MWGNKILIAVKAIDNEKLMFSKRLFNFRYAFVIQPNHYDGIVKQRGRLVKNACDIFANFSKSNWNCLNSFNKSFVDFEFT